VRPRHHDDVRGPGLRHHLRLEVSSVHRLQVRDDRHPRESLAQRAHPAQPLGQDQRRPGLQPVHPRAQSDLGGAQGLVEIGEIE
jgi:hypothetical protein